MRRIVPPILAFVCSALLSLAPPVAMAQEGKPASVASSIFRAAPPRSTSRRGRSRSWSMAGS